MIMKPVGSCLAMINYSALKLLHQLTKQMSKKEKKHPLTEPGGYFMSHAVELKAVWLLWCTQKRMTKLETICKAYNGLKMMK